MITRRALLAAPLLATPALAQGPARVVVIGGGFAGATAARALRRAHPALAVTLVTGTGRYFAAPLSNLLIAGLRSAEGHFFGFDALRAEGIAIVPERAEAVDPAARLVRLAGNPTALGYDRLIMAPGIDPVWGAVRGYDQRAADTMPHAWQDSAGTLLLRRQLAALRQGGLVVIAAPPTPYRCPPAPYERASLIAHVLKARNPSAKIMLLDSKDSFSQSAQFRQAWASLYPGLIEWVGLSDGGQVTEVDAGAGTVSTDFDTFKPDIANIIPPQRAAGIAASVADRTGWCPVDLDSFESRLHPAIHVIGDAAYAGQVGKSAFAAATQAQLVAGVVARALGGPVAAPAELASTCVSLAAPDWGFRIANGYHQQDGSYVEVPLPSTSRLDATPVQREAEGNFAQTWFDDATRASFL